jgi:hypothetical protein
MRRVHKNQAQPPSNSAERLGFNAMLRNREQHFVY